MMYQLTKTQRSDHEAGFTLIESLTVVVMIAIVAAIAAPSWLAFQRRIELSQAQSRVYWAFKHAQGEAKLKKTPWQASFRMQGNKLQYAIHDANVTTANATWYTISTNVQIDHVETTLPHSGGSQLYKVKFGDRGDLDTLGRITLIPREATSGRRGIKRCVFASTLIGSIRMARENSKQDSTGKYCY